jgi:ATP-dependent Clp protease adaptor protein ClpS
MTSGTETQRTTKPRAAQKSEVEPARLWNVVLWNDDVNQMAYVVHVLRRIFGYSQEQAAALMLEAHNTGKTVVATEERERAEVHVVQLHGFGLQATIARAE